LGEGEETLSWLFSDCVECVGEGLGRAGVVCMAAVLMAEVECAKTGIQALFAAVFGQDRMGFLAAPIYGGGA
jgi:hypothetical protein